MKVLTVCRYNQARSITMAAAIKHFYPEIEVESAGTHCDLGEKIPGTTIENLKSWGIEPIQNSTQPFHKAVKESVFDLIISADNSVYRDIKNLIGNSSAVVDMTTLTRESELIPVDPGKLKAQRFKDELAKAIFLAIRAVRLNIVHDGVKNYSILLHKDLGNILARKTVAWAYKTDKAIVDTNWLRPDYDNWKILSTELGIPINLYTPFSLTGSDQLLKGYINISRFETDYYEEQILSKRWKDLLSAPNEPDKVLLSGFGSSLDLNPPTGAFLALGVLHTDLSCGPFLK